MADVTTNRQLLNPNMRFVNSSGRLSGQAYQYVNSIAEIVSAVTIEDGEVTTAKIAADAVTADKISVTNLEAVSATLGNVVVDGDLIVNGTLTTPKYEEDSITSFASAYTASISSFGTGYKVLQQVTITATDDPLVITGSFIIKAPAGNNIGFGFRKSTDSAGTWFASASAIMYGGNNPNLYQYRWALNSPGTGSITFYLEVYIPSSASNTCEEVTMDIQNQLTQS